ncbi:MAG: hypothetical protein CMIDDMOC_00913 [Sodalis sp. Fle]|nr:MAG: hypothetical protein CMIDDMOC_00913 [Sodalis sp. Fle]
MDGRRFWCGAIALDPQLIMFYMVAEHYVVAEGIPDGLRFDPEFQVIQFLDGIVEGLFF